MRISRLSLLAAAGVLMASAPTSNAAARPLLTDPKGDAIALGASWDIVSANLYTTGTMKKVGVVEFLKSCAKGAHEFVGQVADKTDRVGNNRLFLRGKT